MRLATATIEQMFRGRPDHGREDPGYLAGLADTLCGFTPEELAVMSDPATGLMTRLKFLPTPADVYEFLREKMPWSDRFRPASSYRTLEPDRTPKPDHGGDAGFERRRKLVLDALGHELGSNIGRRTQVLQPIVRAIPTAEDMAGIVLKTPPSAPSDHLLSLLRERGYYQAPQENLP